MTTRWFSDETGRHVAATDGADMPGLAETPTPPPTPAHRYISGAWTTDAPLSAEALSEALRKKGVLSKAEIDAERGKK